MIDQLSSSEDSDVYQADPGDLQKMERSHLSMLVEMNNISLIFRMLKVSVNGESQRLVVREVTDLMYNTEQLQENPMVDCWVLVFGLDDKQSFGEKLIRRTLREIS